MIAHPYELIIQFDVSDSTGECTRPSNLQSKIKRSKAGCFNCRKRKKKCDELKPACTSCSSKCIPCAWPKDEKEKLPRSYKIPDVDKDLEKAKYFVKTFIPVEFKKIDTNVMMLEEKQSSPETETEQPITELLGDRETSNHSEESLKKLNAIPSFEPLDAGSDGMPELCTPNLFRSDTLISIDFEDTFKIACIRGFASSIASQYTHPSLSPSTVIARFVMDNPMMDSIASACGCAFLAWNDPRLIDLSFKKYQKATRMIGDYVITNSFRSNDMWLYGAFQMLCLCAKTTFGCTARNSNQNLKMSYMILKRLFHKNEESKTYGSIISNTVYPLELNLGDLVTDNNLQMEIENCLIDFEGEVRNQRQNQADRRFERGFLESFIYHYSVSNLSCTTLDGLPNPFTVFRKLGKALKTPLIRCDVAWMNNPVCGPALDSYELAAKASYLIRHLDDPATLPLAKRLYDIATYSPLPIIPAELRIDLSKYRKLKDSVSISEIIIRASKILLLKAINLDIPASDPLIQKEVHAILRRLQEIVPSSPCKGISTFGLFVCGVACVDDRQRQIIIINCSEVSEMTHGWYIFSVLKALEIAWGKDQSHPLSGKGTDVLLDGEFLSHVTL